MRENGINVMSLFDGMSCGMLALESVGIKVNKYYASEIDKYAIQVSQKNFPNIIRIGDVTKVNARRFDYIHLLIGGSPCQGFSFAGRQLNFEDERSKLFFEFVRILKEIKSYNPNVLFLLENVKMKKEYQDVITSYLGVEPIEINSALVSAQNRKRLYWTNITNVTKPKDKGIMLKDIVHENTCVDRDKSLCLLAGYDNKFNIDRYFEKSIHQGVFNVNPSGKGMNGNVYPITKEKSNCLTTNKGEGQKISINTDALCLLVPEATKKGFCEVNVGDGIDLTFLNSKTRRGRLMEDKSNCLTVANYDYCVLERLEKYIVPFDKTLQILDKEVKKGKVGYFRKDSQSNRVYFIHNKAVTLCGVGGGGAAKMGQYLFGCITPDRVEKRQNGQRFNDGRKFYTLTSQDKHGILIEGYIRKLTPIECERLQTVEDGYTDCVSDSQRYKMLGNGWTIDVISHIFSFIK